MDMAMILEREMGDRLSFMPSGETWIDVVPRGVNKATGLEADPRLLWHFSRPDCRLWRLHE